MSGGSSTLSIVWVLTRVWPEMNAKSKGRNLPTALMQEKLARDLTTTLFSSLYFARICWELEFNYELVLFLYYSFIHAWSFRDHLF